MAGRKPKDFNKEIPKISRVADNHRAPEQLNLDELLPEHSHRWAGTNGTEYGYISRCDCGWQSKELVSREWAYSALRHHLARTPAGGVLVRTFRKFGRGGQGA